MAVNESIAAGIVGGLFLLSILTSLPTGNVELQKGQYALEFDRGSAFLINPQGEKDNLNVETFLKSGFISTWRVIYKPSEVSTIKLVYPNDLIITFRSIEQCTKHYLISRKGLFGTILYNVCEFKDVKKDQILIIEYSSSA